MINTKFSQVITALKNHKGAGTTDILACLNPTSVFGYTQQVHDGFLKYGIDPLDIVCLPQKQVKRAFQFGHGIVAGNYGQIDPTYSCGLYGVILAGQAVRTEGLLELITGLCKPGNDGQTKGVSRAKLRKMFASVKTSTALTKISGAFGANGVFQALGMSYGIPGTANREIYVNIDHPMVKRFIEVVEKLTDAQVESMGKKA
jgi:hypothetical protein